MNKQRRQWQKTCWSLGLLSTVMVAGAAHAAGSDLPIPADNGSRYVLPDGKGGEGYILKGATGSVWAKNQVFYQFDPSISPETRAMMRWAMSRIEDVTAVRFIDNRVRNFRLNIMDGQPGLGKDSCGMSYSGRQQPALQPQPLEVNCSDKRTALHLLMLSMGVSHREIAALPPAVTGNGLTPGEIDAINALYPRDSASPVRGTAQSYQLKNQPNSLCLAADPTKTLQLKSVDGCSGNAQSYDFSPVKLLQCEASQNQQQWHYLADGRLQNKASPELCLGAHNSAVEGRSNRDIIAVPCSSNKVLHLTDLGARLRVRNTSDLMVHSDAGRPALDIMSYVRDRNGTHWSWIASTTAQRPLDARSTVSPFGTPAVDTAERATGIQAGRAGRIGWASVMVNPTSGSPRQNVVSGAVNPRQLVSAVDKQCLTALASNKPLKPLAMQACRTGLANQGWQQASDGKIASQAYPGACLGRISSSGAKGVPALVSCQSASAVAWRDDGGRVQDARSPTVGLSNFNGVLLVDEVYAVNPAWSRWQWK